MRHRRAPFLMLTLLLSTLPSAWAQPPGSPFPGSETSNGGAPSPLQAEASEQSGSDDDDSEQLSNIPLAAPKSQADIEADLARLKDLNLSDSDLEQATRHLREALQATSEFERLKAEFEKARSEYVAETDPRNEGGPLKMTKEWYQNQLDMPIRTVLRAKTSDLQRDALADLTERATRLEEYVNKWATRVREVEAAPTARTQWLNNLPARTVEIQQELTATRDAISRIDGEGVTNPVTSARRVSLVQREARLLAEQAALEARKQAIARGEAVYSLELELYKRKAAFYREELAWLQQGISARRQQEAMTQAQATRQELDANRQLIERYPRIVGSLAERNHQLTTDQQQLAKAIDETIAARTADSNTLQDLRSRFAPIKSEFESDERLARASGQLLRDERNRLPSLPKLRAEKARAIDARNDAAFRRFQTTQELASWQDIDSYVSLLVRDIPAVDRQQAEQVIRNLVQRQREYLEALVRDLNTLEAELGTLIAIKESLEVETREFRDFIAERDLWIRSSEPMHYFDSTHFWGALKWSLSPDEWLKAGEQLLLAGERRPNVAIGGVLLFLGLMFSQREARRRLGAAGREAAKKTCVEFYPTVHSLWLTVIVALPWAVLLWTVGWLLGGPRVEGEFSRALSVAFTSTAWYLLLAEVLRHCFRPDGLADAHFNWPRASLGQGLRWLRLVPFTLIPIVFWSTGLDVQTLEPLWSASLGRALYIGGMLLVAAVLWQVFFRKSSATYQALGRTQNWLLKLHGLWRPALLALPLTLSVMAWVGYYYTAQQLTVRVVTTGIMVFCLMFAAGLWRRWLLLNRRKLAREQARQRRAQAIAAAEAAAAAAEGEAIPPMPNVEFPEEAVDLTAISEQSRKLLQMILLVVGGAGVILIWQNIFPALAWLDRHAVPWSAVGTENPTTLGDLLRAAIACVIAYVLVRDIPSLLELLVLPHLPLDQGARYAIATLMRYALLIMGIIVVASLLRVNPSGISWLVAAMGVGLGFGLQEIFANFVSGVILLFERPIRVGDVVTVGDKTGVVSRIRMRATTITDWDRKEYLVPNKDLVTERLLNWTLSDPTNRVMVNVGVAYGSDTELACQLLRDAAAECPNVLSDPVPVAVFEAFGNSTLNLSLRCFLPNLEKRLDTLHRLHTAIDQKFKEANLEIAFPQLDVHLRSATTLQWERHLSEAATNGNTSQSVPRSS